jgi:hypothetical protein
MGSYFAVFFGGSQFGAALLNRAFPTLLAFPQRGHKAL